MILWSNEIRESHRSVSKSITCISKFIIAWANTRRNTWILKGINNYYDIDCDSDMLRLIVKLSANIRIREFCFSTFLFFLPYLWTFNREYMSPHWTLCSYQKNLHMNTRFWNNFRCYNERLTLLAQHAFNYVS